MRAKPRGNAVRWLILLARSVVAGAGAGVVAAWFIYFVFGFVGLSGSEIVLRLQNGWRAAYVLGIPRGLANGAGIAAGLAVVCIVWVASTARFDPGRARPWLSAAAAVVIVLGNLEALERYRDFDVVGVATVVFMSAVGAGAVWLVAPWVTRAFGSGGYPAT